MTQADLISVIVPVYNREDTLAACVDSARRQTYADLELLLVDDGSTDGSAALCDRLAAEDPRIRVLHKPNGGVSSARNLGMENARGKYVFFLDADDLLHHRALELLHRAAAESGARIAWGDCAVIYAPEQAEPDVVGKVRQQLLQAEPWLKHILYGGEGATGYSCCGILWEKTLISGISFPPITYCEDAAFDFLALAAEHGSVIRLTGQPLYFYVQRMDSVVHTKSPGQLLDTLRSADYLLEWTADGTASLRRAVYCYVLNTAFFAWLQAKSGPEYAPVKDQAMRMIRAYRGAVLRDVRAPIKPKAASLLSFLSMGVTAGCYMILKR